MRCDIRELSRKADTLRLDVVRMVGVGKAGHIGGSCSVADVAAALYFYKMRHDPKNPKWAQRDRFLLSKGHAALIQYAALAECGYFDKSELRTLKRLGSRLQGHPDLTKLEGIEGNTGSLGQGLSMACGMAAGLKLDGIDAKVYCILGDGEIAEGQIWEACMSAKNFRLNNLRVILDKNGLQATEAVAKTFDSSPYREKFEAFGFEVLEIDGHNMEQIVSALDAADEIRDKPVCIIANTVKGKGIPFAEGRFAFHNGTMTQEQYELAVGTLEQKAGAD